MITIVDYGMGNLRSVEKAFAFIGYRAEVSGSPESLRKTAGVVLPGVGAFGDAVRELERRELVQPLLEIMEEGIPLLGICLGYQLLMERSEESPGVRGLGVIPGEVRRFPRGVKVPHMGWNNIRPQRQHPVLAGVEERQFFYFVHSYYVVPDQEDAVLATTDYGIDFASGSNVGDVIGFQFHPEKSSAEGLRLLENFARLCGEEG